MDPEPTPMIFLTVPVAELRESPTNPRKRFDPARLQELTDSVRQNGVLVPLLGRRSPNGQGGYEIVAGARRYRAAQAAGVETVPLVVRDLTDAEVLETQVVEALQGEDLHPLEEAAGYRTLMDKVKGYDVQRIAEKVGKSERYVYDRLKLLALIAPAQKLFLADTITAGHAILLARLKPEDQRRALDPDTRGGGLFTKERLLTGVGEEEPDPLKPVSVREFQGWVDKHVRFDAATVDPMLFPDTAVELATAREAKEKVIPITADLSIDPDAREGRTWGPRSWKRADGLEGSKTCEYGVTGVVAIGLGRGETFKVCTNKDKCTTHWAAEQKERMKRAVGVAKEAKKAGKPFWEIESEKRQAEQAKRDVETKRWVKAKPQVLEAFAAAVKKAPTTAGGALGQIIVSYVRESGVAGITEYVPLGKTAEDLVRHAAMWILSGPFGRHWVVMDELPQLGKAIGVDVKAVVDAAVPKETPAEKAAKPGKPEKAAKGEKGKATAKAKPKTTATRKTAAKKK